MVRLAWLRGIDYNNTSRLERAEPYRDRPGIFYGKRIRRDVISNIGRRPEYRYTGKEPSGRSDARDNNSDIWG